MASEIAALPRIFTSPFQFVIAKPFVGDRFLAKRLQG